MREAADQGLPEALEQLGRYYHVGKFMQVDMRQAIIFLKEPRAAHQIEDLLRNALKRYPENFIAALYLGVFFEAQNKTEKPAVKPGETVGIWIPNRPEFAFLWYGAAQMGAIPVILNTRLKKSEFEYQIAQSESAVVFVPGLAERVFPQKQRQDPLLLDEQRAVADLLGRPTLPGAQIQLRMAELDEGTISQVWSIGAFAVPLSLDEMTAPRRGKQ